MVNAKIIKDHDHPPARALVFQAYEEVLEVRSERHCCSHLIAPQMHEAALLNYGAYDGYRGPTFLQQMQLHARGQPALRGLLPHVEGGLVHIEDLII